MTAWGRKSQFFRDMTLVNCHALVDGPRHIRAALIRLNKMQNERTGSRKRDYGRWFWEKLKWIGGDVNKTHCTHAWNSQRMHKNILTYLFSKKKIMSLFKILAVSVICMHSEESTPNSNNLEALWMSLDMIQWVY